MFPQRFINSIIAGSIYNLIALGKYLEALKKIRAKAMAEIKDKKKSERFLKKLGSEAIKRLRQKKF